MPCNALGPDVYEIMGPWPIISGMPQPSSVTPHVTTSVENYSVWRVHRLAQIFAHNEACK
jgi:hypothetical protein